MTQAQPQPKTFRIPLRIKFTFFVVLTIGTIMALTTWFTYRQQQKSLQDEMIKRGATIARSLASSAAEAVLNDLVCAAMIHETMPDDKNDGYPQTTFREIAENLLSDLIGRSRPYSQIGRNAGVVEVQMVDVNNVIIAHNDIQMVSKTYLPPWHVKSYAGEPILVQSYATSKGERRFDIAVPILVNRLGDLGGKRIGVVHLGMSQKLVDLTVQQAALKLILIMGLMLLLGTVAAITLAAVMTRPIHQLVGGTLAIASGDLNQELRVTTNDELGELTSAFNQMAASLREKEMLKGAFSTYVSSQVMEEVLKDRGKLALGGARKRASVLFTDIRGFTSMSETLEPEEVVKIINDYLSVQTEIIVRNGGMLDKFVGDCAMAVYGTPLAKPGDALRAVRTAVEIQSALKDLNQKRKQNGEHTVLVGIGINTGELISGNMGSKQKMDYTVIGDTVNLAARLESAAEGGSILISEATYQEVKDAVVAEKLAPLPLKGKKDAVQVYSVKGLKA